MEQTTQTPEFSAEIFEPLRTWLTDNQYPFFADPQEGCFSLYTAQCGDHKRLPVWIDAYKTGFTVVTCYDLYADPCDRACMDRAARFVNYLNGFNRCGLFRVHLKNGAITYEADCNFTNGFPSDEMLKKALCQGIELFEVVDPAFQRVILEDLSDDFLEKCCGYSLPWYRVLWNRLTAKNDTKKEQTKD